jgi:hypothetical protein
VLRLPAEDPHLSDVSHVLSVGLGNDCYVLPRGVACRACPETSLSGCLSRSSLGRLSVDPAAPRVRRALEGVIAALLIELGQERVASLGAGVGVRAPDFAARPLNGVARVVWAGLSW